MVFIDEPIIKYLAWGLGILAAGGFVLIISLLLVFYYMYFNNF